MMTQSFFVKAFFASAITFSFTSFSHSVASAREHQVRRRHDLHQIRDQVQDQDQDQDQDQIQHQDHQSSRLRQLTNPFHSLLSPRIIGGSQAPSARYPYAVSLQDRLGHFCGGSLIAPNVVLTAAHCAGGSYDVVVGRSDLNSDSVGAVMQVKKEMVHDDYDDWTTNSDFNLVVLTSSVPSSVVSPESYVKINSQSSYPQGGVEATVMGWGDTVAADDVQRLSDVLMDVTVNVVSNEECEASEGTIGGWYDTYDGQITERMLCAKDDGEDSCQGDSGGPLVVASSSGDVQVGVVSWGIGCASRDFPGVYARVSEVYDWIAKVVCEESGDDAPSYFECGGTGSDGDDDDDDDTFTTTTSTSSSSSTATSSTTSATSTSTDATATTSSSSSSSGAATTSDIPTYSPTASPNESSSSSSSTVVASSTSSTSTTMSTIMTTATTTTDLTTTTDTTVPSTDDNNDEFPPSGAFSFVDDTNINNTDDTTQSGVLLLSEDFSTGYGPFASGGHDVSHHGSLKDRTGVVRLQDGNGDASSILSPPIELHGGYAAVRITLSFYGLSMDDDDEFCIDYGVDDSSEWKERTCYVGGDVDFFNKVWYDGVAVEIDGLDDVETVRVRLRCQGHDNKDDVLIDAVEIRGLLS